MLNEYFHGSVPVVDLKQKHNLVNQLVEELQFANIQVNIKKDLLNVLEIGLTTLYPSIAVSMIEEIELLLEKLLESNSIEIYNGKIRTIPTSTCERLNFLNGNLEFRNFISFLINFTNKESKRQLVRNLNSKEEENSLLLEYYAFLSYNYALFLLEKGTRLAIIPTIEEMNLISANVFERAYELDKEFIICSNVHELEKNYFACIKLLVDGYFK